MGLPVTNWGTHLKYGEFLIATNGDGTPCLLGEGSFGKTFRAVRTDSIVGKEIHTHVALKVLNPVHLIEARKRAQVIREVEALTQVDHPNLIRYIGCGDEKGEIYYAMGLCKGASLAELARRLGPLPERAVAQIALQLAAGLRELGRHNMVHRDIKPSNAMLADEIDRSLPASRLAECVEAHESLVRLVDFGLVNTWDGGGESQADFAGSPVYASPEQLREMPLDCRSDIYSLGMTLWHLLEGRAPFLDRTGTSVATVAEAICRHLGEDDFHASLPAALSGEFKRILAQMLAKNRNERFADAAELLRALRGYLSKTAIIDIAEATGSAPVFEDAPAPLDTLYKIGRTLSMDRARKSYEAVERENGKPVLLTLHGPGAKAVGGIDRLLEQLAKLTLGAECPRSVLRVRRLIRWGEELASIEDLFAGSTLADVLKERSASRRGVSFAEAAPVLGQIAQGLDYLLEHGHTSVLLKADGIWLRNSHRTAGATSGGMNIAEAEARFSAICVRPEWLEDEEAAFGTSTGSLEMSPDDRHPVAAFARLVYRLASGSEAPAVARLSAEGYPPTVALNAGSNGLLRDCINRRKVAPAAGALFQALCASEGVMARGLARPEAEAFPTQEAVASPAVSGEPSAAAIHGKALASSVETRAKPKKRRGVLFWILATSAATVGLVGAAFAVFIAIVVIKDVSEPAKHSQSRVTVTTSDGQSGSISTSEGKSFSISTGGDDGAGPPASKVETAPQPGPEEEPDLDQKPSPTNSQNILTAAPGMAIPDGAQYFPLHAGDDLLFDGILRNALGGESRGTGRIRVSGPMRWEGKSYFKVRVTSSFTGTQSIEMLERNDELGHYEVQEDQSGEQLQCPFPLKSGAAWTYLHYGGRMFGTVSNIANIPAWGKQIDNCCCIDYRLDGGSPSDVSAIQYWRAPGLGLLRAEYLYRNGSHAIYERRNPERQAGKK